MTISLLESIRSLKYDEVVLLKLSKKCTIVHHEDQTLTKSIAYANKHAMVNENVPKMLDALYEIILHNHEKIWDKCIIESIFWTCRRCVPLYIDELFSSMKPWPFQSNVGLKHYA